MPSQAEESSCATPGTKRCAESAADMDGESSSKHSQRRPIDGPRKDPPKFTGEQAMVTINLRKNESSQTIPVHKSFLCYYSPYFEAALNSGFIEGQTQEVTLDGVHPELFDIFLRWIYSQRITVSDEEKYVNTMMDLYLLADRLLIPRLQNEVMEYILSSSLPLRPKGPLSPRTIVRVYQNTTASSPIRLYITELLACVWPGFSDAFRGLFPAESYLKTSFRFSCSGQCQSQSQSESNT